MNTKDIITRREKDVLHCISNGLSTREITKELYISRSTVETHRRNLLIKLDANNSAHLIFKAMLGGLINTNQAGMRITAMIVVLCYLGFNHISAQVGINIDCLDSYSINDTLYRTNNDSISTALTLSSNAIHTNTTESYYSAGDTIAMINGFEVVVGSSYCAEIASCNPDPCIINGMHAAFDEFDKDSYTISYSGTNVVLSTDGLPNHTSPYWSNTTERCLAGPMGMTLCTNQNTTVNHPYFVEPRITSYNLMAPGNIDDFNGSYSLTVPQSPVVANNSSSTGLGAIGLAISGSVIYNDEEGPNIPLDGAVGSLDYNGAHTGPQSYHYHLEPEAWSKDDNQLIGVMADGFFLYGKKCFSTGTYPTDLDASNGHTTMTQHSCSPEYHYHIENTPYLGLYYILFPYDYAGSPSNIN